jgi:tRNA/tmRNA/rRNA uracil-C5-methylase (TrmA/RlmC/RlmD family)
MSLTAGQQIALDIEKPVAGGRMIARHDGQVILVLGAIPGERVRATIERVEKRLAFATATEVLAPSPDRRGDARDPRCGGCLYAHVAYPRQLRMKAEVVADAFVRLARIPLAEPVPVAPSPEHGYRIRARLHVQGGRVGFFREGTHELCDAAATGQLDPGTLAAVEAAVAALVGAGAEPRSLEISENLAGNQRALYIELIDGGPDVDAAFARAVDAGGLTGCTGRTPDGTFVFQGVPEISDPLPALTAGRAGKGELARSPESFFQANRFLLPSLVTTVLDVVPAEGAVLDLYAGVGLFSIALGATGHDRITAVEGDRASGKDLRRNAREWPAVRATIDGVEQFLASRHRDRTDTIIVDPPRTGISKEAMEAIARQGASRIIYVSCDPPTMARDARRLLDRGYRLGPLTSYDLFPNTPHVETVGIFGRG